MSNDQNNELDAATKQRMEDHLFWLGESAGTRFMNKSVPLHGELMSVISKPTTPSSSIYIQGGVGTGKTQQLVEAGRELIQMGARNGDLDSPVMYVTFPEMARNMCSREMLSCMSVPWLLLDEVGYPADEADYANLLEVIDARYRNELPTVFASLYSLADLLDGKRPGWDNRISTRILEMCGNSSTPAPDNYIVLKEQHRMPRAAK